MVYGNNWKIELSINLLREVIFIVRIAIINSEGQVITVSESKLFYVVLGNAKIKMELPNQKNR